MRNMIVSTNFDTYIIYNVYNTHYLLFNKKKMYLFWVGFLMWLIKKGLLPNEQNVYAIIIKRNMFAYHARDTPVSRSWYARITPMIRTYHGRDTLTKYAYLHRGFCMLLVSERKNMS